ncbi:hypothetical protein ACJJTC_006788 [Scirpophaga incertulas]
MRSLFECRAPSAAARSAAEWFFKRALSIDHSVPFAHLTFGNCIMKILHAPYEGRKSMFAHFLASCESFRATGDAAEACDSGTHDIASTGQLDNLTSCSRGPVIICSEVKEF